MEDNNNLMWALQKKAGVMWGQNGRPAQPSPRKPIHNPVILRGFIFDFCDNTSIHGMRYISERQRHWSER